MKAARDVVEQFADTYSKTATEIRDNCVRIKTNLAISMMQDHDKTVYKEHKEECEFYTKETFLNMLENEIFGNYDYFVVSRKELIQLLIECGKLSNSGRTDKMYEIVEEFVIYNGGYINHAKNFIKSWGDFVEVESKEN